MPKILVARYSVIEGLVFETVKEKGRPLPKHKKERKTSVVENKKAKKVRFNRSMGRSSSSRNVAPYTNIVLNVIEQEITNNYSIEPITQTSKSHRQYDKKATLNLKKLRQTKTLMQNASFDFYQEER